MEISIKEIKVYQGRPNVVLRSMKPDGVLQELYEFLVVHYAIRWLPHQASLRETSTLTACPSPVGFGPCAGSSREPRALPPDGPDDLVTEAVGEVLEQQRNPLRLRANPRVLKRAVPRYSPARRRHANWPQPTEAPPPELVVMK